MAYYGIYVGLICGILRYVRTVQYVLYSGKV